MAVQAELKSALLAETSIQEEVDCCIALQAAKKGSVKSQSTIIPIVVATVETPFICKFTKQARRVSLKICGHADAHARGRQLIEKIGGAIGAGLSWGIVVALVAFWVGTGIASSIHCILEWKSSTGILTIAGGEVEERVAAPALPGHHVEYIILGPAEPTGVCQGPWSQDLNSKGSGTVASFVDENPLVLEATGSIGDLECGDPHDEVIDEGKGYLKEASVYVGVPLGEDNKVLLRRLDVVGVEYDLAKVNPLNHYVLPGSNIPAVVTSINYLRIHMKLYLCAKGALHP